MCLPCSRICSLKGVAKFGEMGDQKVQEALERAAKRAERAAIVDTLPLDEDAKAEMTKSSRTKL